jgi:hypothetical protein
MGEIGNEKLKMRQGMFLLNTEACLVSQRCFKVKQWFAMFWFVEAIERNEIEPISHPGLNPPGSIHIRNYYDQLCLHYWLKPMKKQNT